jgi:prepilin-type processing-associated H-X9-DG protein
MGACHACIRTFTGIHNGGTINFAYCDGSVRAISALIDMQLLSSLATTAGEENVGNY